ncbi:alpha/beta hydrolase [Nonomuraea sp. NPDC050691]|uniref:alpha/beta fold hydrolase n=1 Tax=Nonomuraea sp. NPDC050691 TaxID=3155661 RepID=UPI0033E8111B
MRTHIRTLAAIVAVATLWGLTAAWWTPRGPLTGPTALGSIFISAAVGVAAGRVNRSRWILLAAPLAFVLALELARIGVVGPSVDAPRPGPFGIITLVTGRGVHSLLSVFPMLLGILYGRQQGASPSSRGRIRRWLGRITLGIGTAFLALIAVAVAIPASTPALPGPAAVAELTQVDVGAHRLGLLIRGTDRTRPVLLFVPGAPGGSETGAMRQQLSALERTFVVATLDRRGGGSSYAALDPTSTVTVDGAVSDILAVTDYLRQRFRQDKIYLLGHSGGSLLSVLAVQRSPAKYLAYVGTGQGVNLPASDRIFYDDILAWARTTGRRDLADQLISQGAPPYSDVHDYEPIMMYENQAYGQGEPGFSIDASEYSLLEKIHTLNAILDTWSVLYPRMQQTDLRRDVPSLDVPVYFVMGSREMRGLSMLFNEWYRGLRAPRKELVIFEGAGHRAMFDEAERFVAFMNKVAGEADRLPEYLE